MLAEHIRRIHAHSRQTYGSPRVRKGRPLVEDGPALYGQRVKLEQGAALPASLDSPHLGWPLRTLHPANHDPETTIGAVRAFRDSGIVRPTVVELAEAIAFVDGSSANTAKNKVYSAAKFGLVRFQYDLDKGRNAVLLSSLGQDVLDPEKARVATVLAFLKVPANRTFYRLFSTRPFPTEYAEWDHIMRDVVGITAGQVGPARRSIMHSAHQAGLRNPHGDRLVIPPDIAALIDLPTVWASVSFVDKLSLGRLHLLRKVLLEGHRSLVAERGV